MYEHIIKKKQIVINGDIFTLHMDMHCPSCGKSPIWESESHDDYYEGCPHACVACGEVFYVSTGGYLAYPETNNGAILNQLRRETP